MNHHPHRSQPSPTTRPRPQAGFTLIEIMAVVVIMGMLMTVLAVGIGAQLDKARIATARTQIQRIEQSLEFYQLDNARFPTTDQGLQALVEKSSAPPIPKSFTPGGYIKPDALLDPWGKRFHYQIPGSHNSHAFDIWSTGPDPQDESDDIQNWSSGEGA